MQTWATHPLAVGAAFATGLAAVALKRRSLTPAASCAAWVVGAVVTATGPVPFASLATFFFTSTAVTKIGARKKRAVEGAHYKPHGGRSVVQVLCNGAPATLICLAAWAAAGSPGLLPTTMVGPLDGRAALLAIAAQFAAAQGDTWSSELGVLSRAPPRLILGFRRVPAGTNGAVSLRGTVAGALGSTVLGLVVAGAAVGLGTPSAALCPVTVVKVAVGAGVGGSLLDSVLGQLLQSSYAVPVDGAMPRGDIAEAAVTVQREPQPGAVHITGLDVLSNDAVNAVTNAAVAAAVYWCYRR